MSRIPQRPRQPSPERRASGSRAPRPRYAAVDPSPRADFPRSSDWGVHARHGSSRRTLRPFGLTIWRRSKKEQLRVGRLGCRSRSLLPTTFGAPPRASLRRGNGGPPHKARAGKTHSGRPDPPEKHTARGCADVSERRLGPFRHQRASRLSHLSAVLKHPHSTEPRSLRSPAREPRCALRTSFLPAASSTLGQADHGCVAIRATGVGTQVVGAPEVVRVAGAPSGRGHTGSRASVVGAS